MARRSWLTVDGVLLLNKPLGLSSNDALQRVRRAYRARKAGHGGTLDPLATGVLPIAFGVATRFLHDLVEAEKIYTATIRLGVRSSTGDGEGELTSSPGYVSAVPGATQVEAVLNRFRGPISQRAPMYSALKHEGKPLYEYARAGIKIDLPDRKVTIHELSSVSVGVDELLVRVRCSKGTYIRVLAEDIGEALGTGGYLAGLRRDSVGRFDLGQSEQLTTIESAALSVEENAPSGLPILLPVDAMVRDLPEVALNDHDARRFAHGQAIEMTAVESLTGMLRPETATEPEVDTDCRWRVYGDGRFLGLARQQQQMLNPFRVLPIGAD